MSNHLDRQGTGCKISTVIEGGRVILGSTAIFFASSALRLFFGALQTLSFQGKTNQSINQSLRFEIHTCHPLSCTFALHGCTRIILSLSIINTVIECTRKPVDRMPSEASSSCNKTFSLHHPSCFPCAKNLEKQITVFGSSPT